MVFYHGKQISSASTGNKLVDVTCEKCGCEYSYELARVGSGSATAPYGIGTRRAQESAISQARKDLDQRLDEEAELVPCPKCLWINEELVLGYRRCCCRGWANAAGLVALVGSFSSIIAAWFVSKGPAADRGALPYILIGGLSTSLIIPGLILLTQRFLRQRIQPNINYPLAPNIPQGSPTALLRNPSTGLLEPHSPSPLQRDDAGGAWMDFQVGRTILPPLCCNCLAPANPRAAYRRPLAPAVEVIVPLCTSCSSRRSQRLWLGAAIALAVTALIGVPVLLMLKLDEIIFWAVVGVLAIFAPILGTMVADRMASPFRVKVIDVSRGVVALWFRNENFPVAAAASAQTAF